MSETVRNSEFNDTGGTDGRREFDAWLPEWEKNYETTDEMKRSKGISLYDLPSKD